ncbi:MAG: hypothetical protein J2O46_01565, partial [Nocardioides sp.]|nr:hypothetical protein [Nocardioides sp.]
RCLPGGKLHLLGGGGARSAGDPGERPAGDPAQRAARLAAVALAVAGAAWTVATLWLGFGLQSMAGAVVLVALAVAGALASHLLRTHRALVAASAGSLLVLGGVPALASLDHLDDLRHAARPFANDDAIAQAIRPEVTRCAGGTKQALVIPNYLELYGDLGLTNPTPYYLFHYDIAEHRADLTRRLTDGSVPLIIDTMPLHTPEPWLTSTIRQQYTPCAVVRIVRLGMVITVWTHHGRGDVQKHDVRIAHGRRVVTTVP